MTQRLSGAKLDIVPVALFQLGGADHFIDVEDLFIRCFELAPERFGWRTCPYPNYKSLSKALRDYEAKFPSHLVKSPDGHGRQLSAHGVRWLQEHPIPEGLGAEAQAGAAGASGHEGVPPRAPQRGRAKAPRGVLARGHGGFSNSEIVTLAVYLLGGQSQSVETEDVAWKANEMAPGRFSWRKYPNQINIDAVRKRLWDATKSEKGRYLLGSEQSGWFLTADGLEFACARVADLKQADVSRRPLGARERRQLHLERSRLLASAAFEKFLTEGLGGMTPEEAESFFRVDDYVLGEAREQKVLRIQNTFGDDPELGAAVRELATLVRRR